MESCGIIQKKTGKLIYKITYKTIKNAWKQTKFSGIFYGNYLLRLYPSGETPMYFLKNLEK